MTVLLVEDVQRLLWRNSKLASPDTMLSTEMVKRMVVRLLNTQTIVAIQRGMAEEVLNQKTGRWMLGTSFSISSPAWLSSITFSCKDIKTCTSVALYIHNFLELFFV